MSNTDTNTPSSQMPTFPLAVSLNGSPIVHLANHVNGRTFTACNGRGAGSDGTGPATAVTCKRCSRKVTL